MAEVSNPRLLKTFTEKLQRLSCPYTEGVEDEGWIQELIYAPGEPRIRLLQWLFVKFDSQLQSVLEPQQSGAESRKDSMIQRLLFVASTLGFCHSDDVDLVRGVTTGSKQDAFINHLLDLVCISDAAEGNWEYEQHDSVAIHDQYLQCCEYVDRLVSDFHVDSVLHQKVNLLPPDLMKKYEAACAEQGGSRDRPPKPDLQSLQQQLEKLDEDLARQTEILSELNKKFDYKESDESHCDKVSKTLSLVLSELSQHFTGFSYCYQNEMRQWCNKTPPDLTQLGPAFKRVHQILPHFAKLMKNYETIRSSYTKLSRDVPKQIEMAVQSTESSQIGGNMESKRRAFEEWAAVLEDSLSRQRGRTTKNVRALWSASLNNQ